MADDVKISIKTTADLSGTTQTKDAFNHLSAKAKDLGRNSARVGEQSAAAFSRIAGAVGKVNMLLSGFGAMAVFGRLIETFKNLRNAINASEKSAAQFARENQKAADAAGINDLADAYGRLTAAMAEAQKIQQQNNELIIEEVAVRREAEAAALDLEEQKALSAIDPASATAAEERAAISAVFAFRRSSAASSDRKEDIALRRQNLKEAANTYFANADKLEGTLGADRKAILRARTRYSSNLRFSTMLNDYDRDFFSLRSHLEGKTDAGDRERERYRQEAMSAKDDVDKLEARLAEKEKQITALRLQGASAMRRHELLGTSYASADVAGEAAFIQSSMAMNGAGQTLADKQGVIAANLAEQGRLGSAISAGEAQAASLRNQIAFHAQRYGYAQDAAAQAGFDLANAGADGRNAAQNAKYQADKTVVAMERALSDLTAKLKEVENALNRDRNRLASYKENN